MNGVLFTIWFLGLQLFYGVISNTVITSFCPIGYKQCVRECDASASCSNIIYTKENLSCILLAGNETSNQQIQNVESEHECLSNQKKISLLTGITICIYSDCPFGNISAHRTHMLEVGSLALKGTLWTCKTACAVACSGNGTWVPSSDSYWEGTVQLSNVPSGLLEIYHNGTWGTVCDDGFNDVDATVVCKSLGYKTGTAYTFGQASNFYPAAPSQIRWIIWLDDITCSGTESSLTACSHIGWGNHNCVQSENVGVNCF